MLSVWLRYLRLWSIALEARLEIALSRWTVRVVRLLLLILTAGIAILSLTGALIAWTAGADSWGRGFLAGASLWGTLFLLIWLFGQGWLRRTLLPYEATYRLRLAQSGMRLIERTQTPLPSQNLLTPLYPYLGRFVWQIVRRWLRRWIPFL